ncbi:MAG: hypothetical protein AABY07_09800 [Nanoarchaeota archaeon]
MNKQAGLVMDMMPLFIVFVVGTIMILTIGFFLINYMAAATSVTGYSIFGTECPGQNCQKINAGVMALIILALVIFQYFFYKRYRKKSGR